MGRKSLYEYPLTRTRDGAIDLGDKNPRLGSVRSGVDERTSRAAVVTGTVDGEQMIVMCTIKGEIERLSRSL